VLPPPPPNQAPLLPPAIEALQDDAGGGIVVHPQERLAAAITAFIGSMSFVCIWRALDCHQPRPRSGAAASDPAQQQ